MHPKRREGARVHRLRPARARRRPPHPAAAARSSRRGARSGCLPRRLRRPRIIGLIASCMGRARTTSRSCAATWTGGWRAPSQTAWCAGGGGWARAVGGSGLAGAAAAAAVRGRTRPRPPPPAPPHPPPPYTCTQITHHNEVGELCNEQLERVLIDRADDLRLSRTLYRLCAVDVRRFCADEEPGAAAASRAGGALGPSPWLASVGRGPPGPSPCKPPPHIGPLAHTHVRTHNLTTPPLAGNGELEECLAEHRMDDAFSTPCREQLEARLELESGERGARGGQGAVPPGTRSAHFALSPIHPPTFTLMPPLPPPHHPHSHTPSPSHTPTPCTADYQLDWGLREYCVTDIEDLCALQRERIEMAEAFAANGQVIACLEVRCVRVFCVRAWRGWWWRWSGWNEEGRGRRRERGAERERQLGSTNPLRAPRRRPPCRPSATRSPASGAARRWRST